MLQRICSITVSLIALAVAGMAGFVPTPSSAAEGTIFMRVVNIAPNDVLNIREHPTTRSRIIGIIPPNATGIEYLGQKSGNWLLVYFGNAEGWVHKRYVVAEVAAWTRDSEEPRRTFWDHNGSVMYLSADGTRREFHYHQPRRGMINAGARPDSLLFEGEAQGDSYVGQAYIFSRDCGQFGYRVEGPILNDGRKVVLYGQAPRVDRRCRVIGTRPDTLVFSLVPWQ